MRSPSHDPASNVRVLIVAGEASGDLHGANLASELARMSPATSLVGVGGDRMADVGVELLHHIRHLAVVGITEVVRHLGHVHRALRVVVDAAVQQQVDVAVLIDYPDFNLTLARRLRRVRPELPIVYYISPQVWAWRASRIRTIARLIDRMLVILPFERELYEEAGLPVEFVGHPLLDLDTTDETREEFAHLHQIPKEVTWFGLCPGSRTAEVKRLLPPMLEAADCVRVEIDSIFLVPMVAGVACSCYELALSKANPEVRSKVRLIAGDYRSVLRHCRAAAVCSGTATLETALAGTPMVVVYRTSWPTYNLGKLLVRIKDIALVNVIAGRRIVPELVQGSVTGAGIARELLGLIESGSTRQRIQSALAEVRAQLGGPGASKRAARAVLEAAAGSPGGDPLPESWPSA